MNNVSLAQVLEWKYGAVANTRQANLKDKSRNPKMVISAWRHPTIPKPNTAQIAKDTADYIVWKKTQPEKKSVEEEIADIKLRLDALEG